MDPRRANARIGFAIIPVLALCLLALVQRCTGGEPLPQSTLAGRLPQSTLDARSALALAGAAPPSSVAVANPRPVVPAAAAWAAPPATYYPLVTYQQAFGVPAFPQPLFGGGCQGGSCGAPQRGLFRRR